jgi:hypothetical protein
MYLNAWAPSDADLVRAYPHVQLASADTWHPNSVKLPRLSNIEREEIESKNICGVQTLDEARIDRQLGHELMRDTIYNVNGIQEAIISSARTTHSDMEEFKISRVRFKDALPPISTPGPLEEREIKAPYTFLSSERHSNTTPEDLSERWGLSIAQAALTLKATTRHLLRSALMPLARRHRADRMFQANGLQGTWATDTMDMRSTSIHNEKYCQVFSNNDFFAAAYPIEKKGDCHQALDGFVQDFGIMDLLISDGSAEQCGINTEFQRKIRKHRIEHKRSETERPNQNPAEGVIREVRKRWYRTIFNTNCLRRLWTYGLPWICAIMRMTASHAGRLQGRTPMEIVTGETPDISEYLDFGFYDWVWFKRDAGIGEIEFGKFLGISSSTGSLMSYFVLPSSGAPVSRTTVQRMTEIEKQADAN